MTRNTGRLPSIRDDDPTSGSHPQLVVSLATALAGLTLTAAMAADSAAFEQPLRKVMSSDQIAAAALHQQGSEHTVRISLDREKFNERERAIKAANQAGQADNAPPAPTDAERTSFFIGNTMENLRGLTLWWPCGARTIGARLPNGPTGKVQQFEQDNRITVWLLKADGTQIMPTTYNCSEGSSTVDVEYHFTIPERERPVAAAVRIDKEFFIEQIQSPAQARPAAFTPPQNP
jgi:hypothetical protein